MSATAEQIIDFMRGFTIETTPGQSKKLASYQEHLRPGCMVAVTFLPGSDYLDTVATAKRLREEGFVPAPHFAARSIESEAQFSDFVARCVGEAGVEQVVALAGAVDTPVGPYDSSMSLLDTGIFDKNGIKTIGVAGHPEGSPDISDSALQEAIDWKNAFHQRSDAQLYIATQFAFESAPIIAWDRALRASGNALPIHIGVPGLATLKSLLGHAKACGVGASMRILTKQAMNVAKLLTVNAPDQLVRELAHYSATDPDCGISSVHMYPLGGLKKSAAWSHAVVDGHFTLSAKGFDVTVPIT